MVKKKMCVETYKRHIKDDDDSGDYDEEENEEGGREGKKTTATAIHTHFVSFR